MRNKADLEELFRKALDGDELSRWTLKECFAQAMLVAAGESGRIKRQLLREGVKEVKGALTGHRDGTERLEHQLSASDLGSRVADRITTGAGYADESFDQIVIEVQEHGRSVEQAIRRVAFFRVRHILDKEDDAAPVRKAFERAVRSAIERRDIEEVVAVTVSSSAGARTLISAGLVEAPFREQRRGGDLVLYTRAAKNRSGGPLGVKSRRSFIGPPGTVDSLLRESDPWTALHSKSSSEEIRRVVIDQVSPLKTGKRKGRRTLSTIDSIPGREAGRVVRDVALLIGQFVPRALFFSGLYASLHASRFNTVARAEDPTRPGYSKLTDSHGKKFVPVDDRDDGDDDRYDQ